MILILFGIIDIISAILLYLGTIPGPALLIKACIIILIAKSIISFYPLPIFLPGILMNLTDICSAILLFLGSVPINSTLKNIIILILVIKGSLSLIPSILEKV